MIIADVAAGTLNCSAAYLRTAVKGASSGTFRLKSNDWRHRGVHSGTYTLNGKFGSEVSVILNFTFDFVAADILSTVTGL